MKPLIVMLIAFFSNQAFAIDDSCAVKCDQKCVQQAQDAKRVIDSHIATCKNRPPERGLHECASACSFGCKNYVRGQREIVEQYFDNCGGGDGEFGSLICEWENNRYYVFNSHNWKKLGEGHNLSSSCERTANTHNYNLFCAKSKVGYVLTHFANGKTLGKSLSFLDQCEEHIRGVKNDLVCVKEGESRYFVYNITTWKKSADHSVKSFLKLCLESL